MFALCLRCICVVFALCLRCVCIYGEIWYNPFPHEESCEDEDEVVVEDVPPVDIENLGFDQPSIINQVDELFQVEPDPIVGVVYIFRSI